MSALQRRFHRSPLLNPTLLTIIAVCALVSANGTEPSAYVQSVSIINHLLGTAVVALAVPLYRNLRSLRGNTLRWAGALVAGSLSSILLGIIIATLLGASISSVLSVAPKSATAAVSMEIAGTIGGVPAVTACLTILTGITGAVLGPCILSLFGITGAEARGLALGVASHGIATARAFSESESTGCWASLAMGLNAVLTALAVPPLISLFKLAIG
jgi:putative effector of murein hydrolase